MGNYLREPVNGFTHMAGAILSFIGLLAMVIKVTLYHPSAFLLNIYKNYIYIYNIEYNNSIL